MLKVIGKVDTEGGVDAPGGSVEEDTADYVDPSVAAFADGELGVGKVDVGGCRKIDR